MRFATSPRSMMSGSYSSCLLPAAIIQVLIWLEPLVPLFYTGVVFWLIFMVGCWWWRRSPMRGRQLVGGLLARFRGYR